MNARFIIAGAVILLASIGLVSTLMGDPLALLKRILIFAAIAGVIYLVFRKVMMGGKGKDKDQKAFLKAAKQSKKRYNKKTTAAKAKTSASNPFRKKSHRKKSQANLTVIEGKKNRKNRASL
ncbi:SA1362 family protein [Bacillus sp. SCS-153A]|uniref:SA1362 family protein n=1 Tax=Rossellomorea sedimentorum TaxID=3115294 RepID=UPI003905B747